ncbi:Hydrogen cyanide synthase subunit HcnB [Candidatus Izimaplasma bacterium HR1]|jgi:bacterioferritin-associated ferredoxin|uniref:(2Fe-2S)-binding protein n=1 Tax=Candidatus Izimoplasma sp. HR1 TaxID=1541959 RepID=UPI0004F631D8|nr:Hydrogen cyanide synthase subunit HcnB [Candidatus Izimaplasma bacterium HR1]
MNKKDIIICRCEDVTLDDLHKIFEEGYTTFEDIKRILRVGMGPCQGNTCQLLVQREIAKFLKKPLKSIETHKIRPLITGVKLKSIVENAIDES